MGTVKTIGLDITKSVLQVHGVDAAGGVVLRQRLTRGRMLKFFAKLPSCLIGIEACASSQMCLGLGVMRRGPLPRGSAKRQVRI